MYYSKVYRIVSYLALIIYVSGWLNVELTHWLNPKETKNIVLIGSTQDTSGRYLSKVVLTEILDGELQYLGESVEGHFNVEVMISDRKKSRQVDIIFGLEGYLQEDHVIQITQEEKKGFWFTYMSFPDTIDLGIITMVPITGYESADKRIAIFKDPDFESEALVFNYDNIVVVDKEIDEKLLNSKQILESGKEIIFNGMWASLKYYWKPNPSANLVTGPEDGFVFVSASGEASRSINCFDVRVQVVKDSESYSTDKEFISKKLYAGEEYRINQKIYFDSIPLLGLSPYEDGRAHFYFREDLVNEDYKIIKANGRSLDLRSNFFSCFKKRKL